MFTLRREYVAACAAAALIMPLLTPAAHADEPQLINVLLGRTPTSNATLTHESADPTIPRVTIKDPHFATDGDTGFTPNNSGEDANVTKILAGAESGNPANNNGFDTWNDVYLQYDLGESREIGRILLHHNGYQAAGSTFKNVKVEVADTPTFDNPTVISDTADFEETQATHLAPQTILPHGGNISARYIRIWQKGHFIKNFNGNWSGYSNGVAFREIEVMATPKDGETLPPRAESRNIALGHTPYVYGLTPTNISAISDGKIDDNYAVHNSLGQRWLQFEYRNSYTIKRVVLALEPGHYDSIAVDVRSAGSQRNGREIYRQRNIQVGNDPIEITLDGQKITGRTIRFTINKSNGEPTKYKEVEIWAEGLDFNESAPEYTPPTSAYDTLVWQDEFNGDTVDESKWNIIDKMWNHAAIYNRDAVSIHKDNDGSYLSITSKNYPSTQALIDAVGWDQYDAATPPRKVTWSSGRVESKNKYSFQFGRMAVRAKVNDSKGIWPAIWMLAQDETGHDEIDVLEYLGQNPWGAWTTNHYGVLGVSKSAHGQENFSPVAWSQDFHVYEVEWDPQAITWYIDGKKLFTSEQGKNVDGMHTRPMFPILETQVGDGWVGDVDYRKQETKQNSSYLVDWVRVYQRADQPQVRFDDLDPTAPTNSYTLRPTERSEGLRFLSRGNANYENKNNFFYGGQPRYEDSRLAVADNAEGPQYLVYEVPTAKDVHLTTYYQTIPGKTSQVSNSYGGWITRGYSIRDNFPGMIDFSLMSSPDGTTWTPAPMTVVDNFIDPHPGYARTTFDAYDLPADTKYIKVVFPTIPRSAQAGSKPAIPATDIQLAKVTVLQREIPAPPAPPQDDQNTPKPDNPGNNTPKPDNPGQGKPKPDNPGQNGSGQDGSGKDGSKPNSPSPNKPGTNGQGPSNNAKQGDHSSQGQTTPDSAQKTPHKTPQKMAPGAGQGPAKASSTNAPSLAKTGSDLTILLTAAGLLAAVGAFTRRVHTH